MIRVRPTFACELNQGSDGISSRHVGNSLVDRYIGLEKCSFDSVKSPAEFALGIASVAGDATLGLLRDDFGKDTGADGSSTFADGETQVLFECYGV